VPVIATIWGLEPPSSVMLSAAARNPLTDGVKVTLIVHDAPGAIDPALTQLSDSAKSLAETPLIAIAVT
jgi:hypothetical protein